ncbi:MAG: 23S rRNA (adenine(2503)-C(2))-methyltransferase RlmN [Planctomycetia bacterium]|jgi:23S rRNA (adenine2503-C2)-methyltransferase
MNDSPNIPHLLDLSSEALKRWVIENGLPGYRAAQIERWIYEQRAESFEQMTDLPKTLREKLPTMATIWATTVVTTQAADDGTRKLLLELADGHRIECVLLCDDRGHRTACISTQVGCGMGCVFCASGLDGVERNLSAGEIVEQLLRIQLLLEEEERLSHIVVMGMGEPLANLDALLAALATATRDTGLGIGQRRVTISTVGLPEGIRRLAEENVAYHLAVSLHASDDATRNQLIPTNRKVGIDRILEAADAYFDATGRRVTYEYILIDGLNDRKEDAARLAELLAGRCALVNLIPYNPVPGLEYKTPSPNQTAQFAAELERRGLTVHTRYRKGDRIDAACGQLRRREKFEG